MLVSGRVIEQSRLGNPLGVFPPTCSDFGLKVDWKELEYIVMNSTWDKLQAAFYAFCLLVEIRAP